MFEFLFVFICGFDTLMVKFVNYAIS